MKNILECNCQRKEGLKCFKKTNSWIFLISRHFSWHSIPYTSYFWKTQTYLTSDYKIIANMQKCNSVKLKFYYHQSHNKYQGRLLLSLHTLLTLYKWMLSPIKMQFLNQIRNSKFYCILGFLVMMTSWNWMHTVLSVSMDLAAACFCYPSVHICSYLIISKTCTQMWNHLSMTYIHMWDHRCSKLKLSLGNVHHHYPISSSGILFWSNKKQKTGQFIS